MAAPQTTGPRELLYVGNNQGGTISVIEVPGYKVIGEFDALPGIADRPPGAVADDLVGPASGDVLYVSRGQVRDVAAFSTATEKLLWRVPMGGVADHVTLSADGRLLFVSVESEGHVLVIDTAKRAAVGRFESGPITACHSRRTDATWALPRPSPATSRSSPSPTWSCGSRFQWARSRAG